ncbi:MAG: shikimate kinase [Planctomycetota bacterium]
MNIVLIGYRGTGKTTIGKRLADELGLPYVGLDEEIVRREGLSIPEIVARRSWAYFRDREEALVAEYAARDGQVIDTGGGVVTRPANVERLRRGGIVFLLWAEVPDIVSRIGGGAERPSLTGTKSFTEEVADVLREREPLYRSAADHVVDTSRLSVGEAVREIAGLFRRSPGGPRPAGGPPDLDQGPSRATRA